MSWIDEPDFLAAFACRMNAADGPECFCGRPSFVEAGLCQEHSSQERLDEAYARWKERRELIELRRALGDYARVVSERAAAYDAQEQNHGAEANRSTVEATERLYNAETELLVVAERWRLGGNTDGTIR